MVFQNENLVAKYASADGSVKDKVLAIVPDIISVVDTESGNNLLKYIYKI